MRLWVYMYSEHFLDLPKCIFSPNDIHYLELRICFIIWLILYKQYRRERKIIEDDSKHKKMAYTSKCVLSYSFYLVQSTGMEARLNFQCMVLNLNETIKKYWVYHFFATIQFFNKYER